MFCLRPDEGAVPRENRGSEKHAWRNPVLFDSCFLVCQLLWSELMQVYVKPPDWVPGRWNTVQGHVMFAQQEALKLHEIVRGLDGENHRVIRVVSLARSIRGFLRQRSSHVQHRDLFSWVGFRLADFDASAVSAKVAKLSYQYLPSVPLLEVAASEEV